MLKKQYTDLFYGNGEIDHPTPEGIAATWFFIKAQCGNTHPHAALPFGKMSCGLYTGGYPTGYGNHKPNSCGPVSKFDAFVKGFAHMHQTGTGGIGAYYNYALTSAVYGGIAPMKDTVVSENAEPGYYSVCLESGIQAEFTVDGACAVHRYLFKDKATLYIDFSNDGLDRSFNERFYGIAKNAKVVIESENAFSASVTLQGIPTYFYAKLDGMTDNVYLWEDYEAVSDSVLERKETSKRIGGAFSVSGECVLKVAISHKSVAAAKDKLYQSVDFDTARKNAEDVWERYLSAIEIDADDEVKYLFYSNLYHSILKPAKLEDNKLTDFATLWDMYKTQLPLVYSLYAEESRKIVDTLLDAGKTYGKVPTALMLWDNTHRFDNQAQLLSVYTLADAYFRGLANGKDVVTQALSESKGDPNELVDVLLENEKFTHILDLTEACASAEVIALEEGDYKSAEIFKNTADKWLLAFDKQSGMLRESTKYYEGNSHSYSFRLLHDMEKRIELCGGREPFCKIADEFFGYGFEPVKQCAIPDDYISIEKADLRRFDGINNEHDIEAPYVYAYAGCHERVCEIVRGIQKFMFSKGRGGLPGNNDTGALSSWYVWNALGLFPVTGQDKILISCPLVNSAKLKLSSGNELKIKVIGSGDYVEYAQFCGKRLSDFSFSVREMMNGGELVIKLYNKIL